MTLHAPAHVGADYDAIHAAVMETARGRWFLKEYARRNRNADTTLVLAAIERIEAALRNQAAIPAPHPPSAQTPPPQPSAGTVPPSAHTLHELRDAIVLTKDSLPAIDPEGRIAFKADFGRIPSGVATVADRMRASAEQVQETAWFLRERAERETGALKDALATRCNELETQARELTAACAQLDQLSESASMIADLLAEIEMRLDGMISAPAQAEAPPEPVAAGKPFAAPAKEEPPAPPPVAEMPVRDEPSAPPPVRDEPQPPPAPAFVDIPPITTTVVDHPPAAPKPEPAAALVTPLAARFDPVPEAVSKAAASEPAPEIAAEGPAPQPPPTIEPQIAAAATKLAPAASTDNWMDALAPMVRARNMPEAGPSAAISFDFEDAPPATGPATAISFDFDDAPPAIAMPNPARRETPASDPVPRPESADAPPVVETAPAQTEIAEPEIAKPNITKPDLAPTPLVPRIETRIEASIEASIEAAPPTIVPEPAREPEPVFRTAVTFPDDETSDDPGAFRLEWPPQAEPPAQPRATNGSGEHAAKPAIHPVHIAKPADVLAPIMALSDEEKIALFS